MSGSPGPMVLVTGASSGIGEATALLLAGEGFRVIGASRSQSRLEPLRSQASSRGLEILAVELDVNDGAQVGEVLPRLMAEHGPIDVLVNNAGYGLWAPVEKYSVEELRDQFETNLFAPVRLIQVVLPGMMAQRRGAIINVSSYLGRLATPFHSAYASSKFALEGLSESLRTELRPFGIRVALVEPGVVRTNFRSNQAVPQELSDGENVYSSYMEVYLRRYASLERHGTDPVKVARVIYKAIRSRSPGLRHPVGLDARLGMLAARLLPERVLHALVGRVTMGQVRRNGAGEAGSERGTR